MEHHNKLFLLLMLLIQVLLVAAQTNSQDYNGLAALTGFWTNKPPNWVGTDPCGSNWEGIRCSNSRITELKLLSMNLEGQLSSAIQQLPELDTLDLSYNTGLTGTIPQEIGSLKKLKSLALVGCGLSGPIPDSIGALKQLTFLALNMNRFNGTIPGSIGNLTNINWFDVADNQLEGQIPVSDNKGRPGLDLLLQAQHFHMGNNKFSGQLPEKLFNSKMILEHVLLDNNQLQGSIPSSLGQVSTLEVL
ncbi:hypothetical protein Ahy_B10g101129 isoform E [Arachis hypogaea]|nr:hypothetical protein Ahy_B10g101129 isoform E [Arachis hypogaea]